MLSKKLFYFGNLNDPWNSWVYHGTVMGCRRWLKKEGVMAKDIPEWMSRAIIFVQEGVDFH